MENIDVWCSSHEHLPQLRQAARRILGEPSHFVETASVQQLCHFLKNSKDSAELPMASYITLDAIIVPMVGTLDGRRHYYDFIDVINLAMRRPAAVDRLDNDTLMLRARTDIAMLTGCSEQHAVDELQLRWLINDERLADVWAQDIYTPETWNNALEGVSHIINARDPQVKRMWAWSLGHRPTNLRHVANNTRSSPVHTPFQADTNKQAFAVTLTYPAVINFLSDNFWPMFASPDTPVKLETMNEWLEVPTDVVVHNLEHYMWYNRSETQTDRNVHDVKRELRAQGLSNIVGTQFDDRVYQWYIVPSLEKRVVVQIPEQDINENLDDLAGIAFRQEMWDYIEDNAVHKLVDNFAPSGLTLADEITFLFRGQTFDFDGREWWNMAALALEEYQWDDFEAIVNNVSYLPNWDAGITVQDDDIMSFLEEYVATHPTFLQRMSQRTISASHDLTNMYAMQQDPDAYLQSSMGYMSEQMQTFVVHLNPEYARKIRNMALPVQKAFVEANPWNVLHIDKPHTDTVQVVIDDHPYMIRHLADVATVPQMIQAVTDNPSLIQDLPKAPAEVRAAAQQAADRMNH